MAFLIGSRNLMSRKSLSAYFLTILLKHKREPFQNQLYWECDDVKYGRCNWLSIEKLDTLSARAAWHTDINFPILKWNLARGRGEEERDTALTAYQFYKKSERSKAVIEIMFLN